MSDPGLDIKQQLEVALILRLHLQGLLDCQSRVVVVLLYVKTHSEVVLGLVIALVYL